ncbi:MAG: GAF domain-containing protein [Terriglobia bacterium]
MNTNERVVDAIKQLGATTPDSRTLMDDTVRLLQRERPHYHWVGFYMIEGDVLVLGPFAGKPTEHVRIPLNQGICGAAASTGETVVIDDVTADPRYLACSLETRSEIVVPIRRHGRVVGELDLDSDAPAAFTAEDRALLEQVAEIIGAQL